jgi:hypothetical protein
MPYGRRELWGGVVAMAAAIFAASVAAALAAAPAPDEIVRQAEQQRGLPMPHAFVARISSESRKVSDDGDGRVTVVEVRSNGFAQQLVFVLAPNRGDVMLATPDVVWLRPRRLHRLTRIPPDLRMFSGASVADVTSIDLVSNYTAVASDTADEESGRYRVELTANRAAMRYPRAVYWVRREDCRPVQVDFMTASRKVLKTIVYAQFGSALGRIIPTELIVRDHVYRDSSVVRMSEFRLLSPVDPGMFVPDYLLTIADPT